LSTFAAGAGWAWAPVQQTPPTTVINKALRMQTTFSKKLTAAIYSITMKPLIAVLGPTGSGKSALGIHLAGRLNGEIVNCDSMQLYRGFDIGTAKSSAAERAQVPHHLFDVLEAPQSYSAGDYARAARQAFAEIAGRGRVPVVVGGTGFYVRAALEGLPALPGRDEMLRLRLAAREQARPGNLHRLLRRLEPGSAARIHPNDAQKTLRALEIRLLTGGPAPAPAPDDDLKGFRIRKIALDPPREELHRRLAIRTQAMFAGGLLEEVRGILDRGASGNEKPFESLGYKQALAHLRGEFSLADAIESTLVETRQYANRQWTWFRRDPEICWLKGFGDDPAIAARAEAALNG